MPRNSSHIPRRGPPGTGDQVRLVYRSRRSHSPIQTFDTDCFICVDDALAYYRHNYQQYDWLRGFYTRTGWDDTPRYTNPSTDERRKLQRKVYALRSSAKRGMVNAK